MSKGKAESWLSTRVSKKHGMTLTLRKKTIYIVSLTLVALVFVLYYAISNIMLGSFSDVEQMDVCKDVQRFREALSNNVNAIKVVAEDYAKWDVTLAFIEDANEEYVELYLTDQTFTNARLNLILLIHSSGRTVFGSGFDLKKGYPIPVPNGIKEHLAPDSLLINHPDTEGGVAGMILLPEGPMLVVSEPVQTSASDGPIGGSLIMGRYLDMAEIQRLAGLTLLSLTSNRFNDTQMPLDFQIARSSLVKGTQTLVRPLSDDSVAGYTLLEDIYGAPGLLVRVDMPRDILKEGRLAIRYLLVALLVVGLVLVGVIAFLLDKLVLSRMARLNTQVSRINMNSGLSERVSVSGRDELSNLGGAINGMLDEIQTERGKSEVLLLNVLPQPIAERLKQGESTIADSFTEVSVLFADVVDFTKLSARMPPAELVDLLNELFSAFDHLTEKHGLEKIKTIGDAYMVVGGLPHPRTDHAEAIAEMALDMQDEVARLNAEHSLWLQIRCGINSGPVVAGVVGTTKFIYDLWGDTVNTAARMESHGVGGRIQMTAET